MMLLAVRSKHEAYIVHFCWDERSRRLISKRGNNNNDAEASNGEQQEDIEVLLRENNGENRR